MTDAVASHDRWVNSRAHLSATMQHHGGIATRDQLRAAGFSGPRLTVAVHHGELVRLRRAWYALPDIDDERRAAIMLGGRIGGLSAAASYGWWRGLDTSVHVSWAPHGNIAKPGRVAFAHSDDRQPHIVHHWRTMHDVPLRRTPWRESKIQALAQVLLSCDRDTAVACANSALRIGNLRLAAVLQLFEMMPDRVKAWLIFLRPDMDSGLESIVLIWLIERGIAFTHHPAIGGIRELDFLIGRSLVIETDGRAFHDREKDAARDARNDHRLALRGYIVLRLRYAEIMYNWAGCVALILEHMSRGDHLRRVTA